MELVREMDAFLQYMVRYRYSHKTIRAYKKGILRFYRFMENMDEWDGEVENISRKDIFIYIDLMRKEQLKQNSISLAVAILKSFFKYLQYEESLVHNPMAMIRSIPKEQPLPTLLEREEIEAILRITKDMNPMIHVLIAMLYYTGSRITAIRTLELKNIGILYGKIYLPYIKGGRNLLLPMHDQLNIILEFYIDNQIDEQDQYLFPSKRKNGASVSRGTVEKWVKIVAKKANIHKKVTPHVFRHSMATHLTVEGVQQVHLASLLGHKDLRSPLRYQHLNVEQLRVSLMKL